METNSDECNVENQKRAKTEKGLNCVLSCELIYLQRKLQAIKCVLFLGNELSPGVTCDHVKIKHLIISLWYTSEITCVCVCVCVCVLLSFACEVGVDLFMAQFPCMTPLQAGWHEPTTYTIGTCVRLHLCHVHMYICQVILHV